jgi:mRNA interferase MazF
MSTVKRGEVWWTDFEPALGGETRKKRPAIVVSNNSANQASNRLQAVPLTSNVTRLYPGEVVVLFNYKPYKAVANQIKTVSKLRVLNKMGQISDSDLRKLEEAIKVQLGLT